MTPKNKLSSVKSSFIAFVLVVIAFGGGFYLGKIQGTADLQKKADELTEIIQVVYPPPPEVIHTVNGVVTDRYGAVLTVEFDDPGDYLPHLDNSPRAKRALKVTLNSATKVQVVDYTKTDTYGSPTVTSADASTVTITTGTNVKFTTDANVRDSQTCIATSVDVILR